MLRGKLLLAVTIVTLLQLAQSESPPPVTFNLLLNKPLAHEKETVRPQVNDENDSQMHLDPNYWDDYEVFSPSRLEYDGFDWTFARGVASSSNGNTLISPLSVKLTLGILYEAATGSTAFEIERVLGLSLNRQDVRSKFYSINSLFQRKSDHYALDVGSRMYLGKEVSVRQKFSAIASDFYNTDVEKTDFDHPNVAAGEINEWVSNITHNKIKNLVSEDDVTGVVMLVLNAIYFKGSWRQKFSTNETKIDQFIYENSEAAAIPFMNLKGDFFLCKSDALDATILRLPYEGLKFAMYIILPNTITGINHVMEQLNSSQLRYDILSMRKHSVRLSLPKFRFEYTTQLKEILQSMGIRQAFESTASFPGISRGENLDNRVRVSSVKQKAGIEINEEGSEAYAATEVTLVNKSGVGKEDTIDFKVNKSFLFFIEDENTRQVLFVGKVMKPQIDATV